MKTPTIANVDIRRANNVLYEAIQIIPASPLVNLISTAQVRFSNLIVISTITASLQEVCHHDFVELVRKEHTPHMFTYYAISGTRQTPQTYPRKLQSLCECCVWMLRGNILRLTRDSTDWRRNIYKIVMSRCDERRKKSGRTSNLCGLLDAN